MSYSEFTSIIKVKQAFGLTTVEGPRFLPQITAIAPSATLTDFLANSLPVAVATGSEKARSSMIITPVLLATINNVRQARRNLVLIVKQHSVTGFDVKLTPMGIAVSSISFRCYRN